MLKKSKLHNLLVYNDYNDKKHFQNKKNYQKSLSPSIMRNSNSSKNPNLSFIKKSFHKRSNDISISKTNNYSLINLPYQGRNKYQKNSSNSFYSCNLSHYNIENNAHNLTFKSNKRLNITPLRRKNSKGLNKSSESSFLEQHIRSFSEFKGEVNNIISKKFLKFKDLRSSVENLKNRVNILRIDNDNINTTKPIDTPKLVGKIKKLKSENTLDIPFNLDITKSLIKENQMKLDLNIFQRKIINKEQEIEKSHIARLENEINVLKKEIKKMEKEIFCIKNSIQSFKKVSENVCFRIKNNNILANDKMERVRTSFSEIKERLNKKINI